VLYLVKDQPEWTPPLVTEVGVRLPAHLTASGRALLATLSAAQVHALFPPGRPLATRTGAGPTSPATLRRRLAATRRRGHGEEDGEVVDGIASVAVAARDHDGRGVAAVTLVFRRDDHDAATRRSLVAAATATANTLTQRLHGRPDGPRSAPGGGSMDVGEEATS
jgi:DNA-binding IclR family transcriptional regulator